MQCSSSCRPSHVLASRTPRPRTEAMPDVGQVLKAEITRLARKEVKRAADPLHASIVSLKQRVSDLRKRAARLERDNQRLLAAESTRIQRGTSLELGETEAMRVISAFRTCAASGMASSAPY